MRQLTIFKNKFDKAIFSYVAGKEKQMKKLDEKGGDMVSSIQTFLEYGGKRFRPALFYLAYESYTKKNDFDSLSFSFIFELFHTFALIHDDIIDHATLRRGNPTIHTQYGLHMGILSGDFALTLVDEIYLHLINQSKFSASQIDKANLLFNAYKQELLVGQYLDCIHLDDRGKIMRLKTADYSFVKPVLFALLLTNQDTKTISKWQRFLTRLGIVFQLKDDFDGVFSDEKHTGKSSQSDTQEGKNTMVVELFRKRADKTEFSRLSTFFGKSKISISDFEWYLHILTQKKIKEDMMLDIQTECAKLETELRKELGEKKSIHILINEIISYINTF